MSQDNYQPTDSKRDRFYKPKKRFETRNSDDELESSFRNMTVHDDRGQNGGRGNRRGNRGRGRGGSGRGRVQESYMRSNNKPRPNSGRNEAWKTGLKNLDNPNTARYDDRENERLNKSNGDGIHRPKENKHIKTVKGPNTVQFKPSYEPPDLRLIPAPHHWTHYERPYSDRDVVTVNGLFCLPDDLSIYNQLLDEIESSGVDGDKLWQLWHNDSHLIADDKTNWKRNCPTFNMVLTKMAEYFKMDVQATRFNWYRNSSDWKPFHHDAAAVKPDKARTQNLTISVSFGMEREVAFEHAKNKSTVCLPLPNGSLYSFGKDVNVTWRHGVPAVHPRKFSNKGRISIVAWGWIDDMIEE